jgi:hypothetical protein
MDSITAYHHECDEVRPGSVLLYLIYIWPC